MPNKLTYNIVKKRFENAGLQLLDTEYISDRKKMKYKCPKGHIHETTVNNLLRGRGCPSCWKKRRIEQRITPIEELKKEFKEDNYNLINDVYASSKQTLIAKCPKGHKWETSVRKWRQGYRCKYCAKERNIERLTGENNPGWNPDREAVIHNKKIWTAWRNLIRSGATGKNKKTSEQVKHVLGYTWAELRDHLRSHPNWNECKHDYQVDHIFPIKAFRDYGIEDPSIVCSLDNLQPMATKKNQKKNANYNKEEFEKYLSDKGLL